MSRIPLAAPAGRLRFSDAVGAASEWLLIVAVIAAVAVTVLIGG